MYLFTAMLKITFKYIFEAPCSTNLNGIIPFNYRVRSYDEKFTQFWNRMTFGTSFSVLANIHSPEINKINSRACPKISLTLYLSGNIEQCPRLWSKHIGNSASQPGKNIVTIWDACAHDSNFEIESEDICAVKGVMDSEVAIFYRDMRSFFDFSIVNGSHLSTLLIIIIIFSNKFYFLNILFF